MRFFRQQPKPPADWRKILETAVYNRIHRVECTWEEYWDNEWADETVSLLEAAPDSDTAIYIAEHMMKIKEEPLTDRRDYERLWAWEMCGQ